jgi:hypothetical protein
MKQVLAILQKDVRRSRAPLAVATGLTAVLAILTPRYEPFYDHGVRSLDHALDVLQILLPFVWWAAVAHVVQGEPLAGDRQFWLTRPYSRLHLLGAKLLFCAAFLLGPFLLADLAIVAAMGFSPAALFPRLLLRQLTLGGALLVPAFIAAALTRSMRQFILFVLACGVALTVLIPLVARQPGNFVLNRLAPSSPVEVWFDHWFFALWCAVTLSFLVWLYGVRRVGIARGVALGATALLFASTALPSRTPVPAPPAPGRHPEIAAVFVPENGPIKPRDAGKTQVELPIGFTGRARDLLDWQLGTITVTPADGIPWQSNWDLMAANGRSDVADAIEINLNSADYERLTRGPVRIDAVLGVTVYDRIETVAIPRMDEWTTVPGIGKVQLHQIYLWWRTPFGYPPEKLVYRPPGTGQRWHASSFGHFTSQLFNFSPIASWVAPLDLTPGFAVPQSLEIDVERETDFIRRELTIPSVRLSDFVVK